MTPFAQKPKEAVATERISEEDYYMALDTLDQVQIGLGSAIEEAVRWAVPIIQRILPEMDGHYLLDCLKEANTEAQSLKRALEEAGPGGGGGCG